MYKTITGRLTCTLFGPVVENLVDDGTGVLLGNSPVVGCHVILRLFELVRLIIIVVRHLGRATRREADLGL